VPCQLPHVPSSSSPAVPDDHELYDFGVDLQEFICRRLDRVNPYKESKEYCLEQEKAARLHDRLMEMLPEEGRRMLLEYGEAMGAAHFLETALLAEKAFLDGMRIVMTAMTEDNMEC